MADSGPRLKTVTRSRVSLGRGLGEFHEDVEVAVFIEDAGVEQLEFRLVSAATAILGEQPRVGKFLLGILVQHFHVGMRRCRVEVIVQLLDVFTVVAFAVGQAEKPLLEDRVAAVPERQREAKAALIVGPAGDSIFTPSVGALVGMVEWEIGPAIAAGTVVFPDGAPLAVGYIGPQRRQSADIARDWSRRSPSALFVMGRYWSVDRLFPGGPSSKRSCRLPEEAATGATGGDPRPRTARRRERTACARKPRSLSTPG